VTAPAIAFLGGSARFLLVAGGLLVAAAWLYGVRARDPRRALSGAPRRIPSRGLAGGVCAGIAYHTGVPSGLVRLAALALVLATLLTGALAYLVLWILMPSRETAPGDFDARTAGGRGRS